uniref:Uncharacterized protein n=1 Tax=Meloidogyne incognita TaxID=6306 RepID=A0A914LDR9_MELIC
MRFITLIIHLELFLFLHLKGSSSESPPADLCAGKRCPNGFACTILINTNGDRWGSCQPNKPHESLYSELNEPFEVFIIENNVCVNKRNFIMETRKIGRAEAV